LELVYIVTLQIVAAEKCWSERLLVKIKGWQHGRFFDSVAKLEWEYNFFGIENSDRWTSYVSLLAVVMA